MKVLIFDIKLVGGYNDFSTDALRTALCFIGYVMEQNVFDVLLYKKLFDSAHLFCIVKCCTFFKYMVFV